MAIFSVPISRPAGLIRRVLMNRLGVNLLFYLKNAFRCLNDELILVLSLNYNVTMVGADEYILYYN